MLYPRSTLLSLLKVVLLLITFSASCLSSVSAQDQVRIGGTGGPLAAMKKLGSEFHRINPHIGMTVLPSLGSSGGIKAVLAGALDIAVSGRPLDDKEQGAVARELGRTPFVFTVVKKNRLSNVTLKELEAIYSGKTMNWPDGSRIRVVLRPAAEYDTFLLKSMSQQMERAVSGALDSEGMIVAVTDQDNADAVEKVPGALGTITLAQIISEERPLKALSLNNVRPGTDGAAYPYFKTYYLVTKPGARTAVLDFIHFIYSKQGREILSRCGYQMIR